MGSHTRDYEALLGMAPSRRHAVRLREAVVFQDYGQNRSKHARFRAMSERLQASVPWKPHPGVFLVRGTSGDRRVLVDELELAERLRVRRGFKSRRFHPARRGHRPGLLRGRRDRDGRGGEPADARHPAAPAKEARVLALQPPDRFVGLYKHLTDRDGQHFGFVVGNAEGRDFRVDPDEVERTLDLFAA